MAEGYVVGSFVADVIKEGQVTGEKTGRGYCILLKGSKNKSMDFYTFNFPDDFFQFQEEQLISEYNGNNCGPSFFPDSLKYIYKIKFSYQLVEELNKVEFVTGACTALYPTFAWDDFNQVILFELTVN
ncbi:hypothetical protein [Sunxiuqinia elliptica]|uniref:Uncharacterized protein n=1 Tax=Sunxiuqinia elliptica TaxID=655355 RepID=A0A4R6HAX4_9BACT|nr:hypothetical protein [Sunxiuqinia elliptica]TDO04876.1 hypothetical protein DET52_101227 [Sunxiuqinia elliptica]TDO64425.1 hypothetical protein DET65_0786 [Sunxiuqinia elliptica]